jgi:hypothetical protein
VDGCVCCREEVVCRWCRQVSVGFIIFCELGGGGGGSTYLSYYEISDRRTTKVMEKKSRCLPARSCLFSGARSFPAIFI